MKIAVSEITDFNLYQPITCDSVTHIEAIRPQLYLHNHPSGSVKVRIADENDEVVAESESLNFSDISSANYFHGYVRFYINASLMPNTVYRLRLITSGYTYSETSFLGWCHEYELKKYTVGYSIRDTFHAPLDFEVWERSL